MVSDNDNVGLQNAFEYEPSISTRLQFISDKIREVADLIQLVDYLQTGKITPKAFIEGFDSLYPTEHEEFIHE